MKQIYVVTEIQDYETVIVSPEMPSEKNKEFSAKIQVSNPKKLKIEKGSKVTIGLSQKEEAAAGIAALFIPIICTAAGLIFSEKAANLLKTEYTETFKIVFSSFCFFISSFFAGATLRTAPAIVKLEISRIVQ